MYWIIEYIVYITRLSEKYIQRTKYSIDHKI